MDINSLPERAKKNAETCPAVFHTLEQLKQEF